MNKGADPWEHQEWRPLHWLSEQRWVGVIPLHRRGLKPGDVRERRVPQLGMNPPTLHPCPLMDLTSQEAKSSLVPTRQGSIPSVTMPERGHSSKKRRHDFSQQHLLG